jgi:hypothetical protein
MCLQPACNRDIFTYFLLTFSSRLSFSPIIIRLPLPSSISFTLNQFMQIPQKTFRYMSGTIRNIDYTMNSVISTFPVSGRKHIITCIDTHKYTRTAIFVKDVQICKRVSSDAVRLSADKRHLPDVRETGLWLGSVRRRAGQHWLCLLPARAGAKNNTASRHSRKQQCSIIGRHVDRVQVKIITRVISNCVRFFFAWSSNITHKAI